MSPTAAAYTPISVAFLPEPLITWADLTGVRFEEPFFRQTIARVETERPKLITGIDALRACDVDGGLDPSLIVFHASRCGSTLLAQMLAALPTSVVISEPTAINQALVSPLPTADRIELVRLLVRAFGRNQPPGAGPLVLKLSSWNVCLGALVRAAFPKTPLVWLQRNPAAIVASQVERPAGWVHWHREGDPAVNVFGMTIEETRSLSEEAFILSAIRAIFAAAAAFADGGSAGWQVADYAELPEAAWTKVAKHAGISLSHADLDRLRVRARFNAKTAITEAFIKREAVGDGLTGLSDATKRFVAAQIDPLYRALGDQEPRVQELRDRLVDG
ncbi:MAG TPA: hypothetical protein VGG33_02415 [Polyangia bacterium]